MLQLTSEKQKIVFISGSAKGIGSAISQKLFEEKFELILHYNNSSVAAEKLKNKFEANGGVVTLFQCDLQNPAMLSQKLPELDLILKDKILFLVNNAGMKNDNLLSLLSDTAFDDVMKVNLYSPFVLLRWASRKMLADRAGAIVNVSSVSAQLGQAGQANYAASKAGLIAMTKVLARELGPREIRVNSVALGLIKTEMTADLKQVDSYIEMVPLKRMGTPEEVAEVVNFLLSDSASYITGQTINVNGGLITS